MKPRITQSDIAEEAGVSVMTVSRALRGDRAISARTLKNVRLIAQRMGYTPDPALASLVAYRQKKNPPRDLNVVAYVTNWETPDNWKRDPIHRQVYEAAVEHGKELGYKVENFWLNDPKLRARDPSDVLYARGIRAIIIAPQNEAGRELQLDWDKFSALTIGYTLHQPKLNYVAPNHFKSMTTCVKHLRERGYRRIGFHIRPRNEIRTEHRWLAAFLYQQFLMPVDERVPPFIPNADLSEEHFLPYDHGPIDTPDDYADAFKHWIDAYKIDVILSENLLEFVQSIGYRVPDDIGYADLSVETLGSKVSGNTENAREIGVAAIEQVNSLLQLNQTGIPPSNRGLIIPGCWNEGNTVRTIQPILQPTSRLIA